MKKKIILIFLSQNTFFLLFLLYGAIITSKVEIISDDSKYDNIEYLNFFKIPKSFIDSYIPNGGSKRAISYAYDNDYSSYWVSLRLQGEQKIDSQDPLINNIIITFKKTVTVDRMLYKTISTRKCVEGYPNIIKIYYKKQKNNTDFILADTIISEPTDQKVIFQFSDSITCEQIKIEWDDINKCEGAYKGNALASDISFFIPETRSLNEKLFDAFDKSDYRELTLNNSFVNKSFIELLKNDLKKISFSDYATNYVQKIISIFEGNYIFDSRREFTLNQSAIKNVIYKRGDISTYARNVLLMSRGGSNRQLTGIYGRANETIIIYTKSKEGNNLPCIKFSQYIGHWTNWLGNTYYLKKPKEIFTVDYFEKYDKYEDEIETIPGGPIYFYSSINPDEDNEDVEIYIEGGVVFPIFKLGESDEETYMKELEEYLELYEENQDTYLDITEFYSKRAIISVRATMAYEIYKDRTKGPEKNLENWDEYIKKLYIFDGIQFEKNQPYYNPMNEYVNMHIRYSQPYAYAYASNEHIGIFHDEMLENAIYLEEKKVGYAFPHEIGHMMDINFRTVNETSNNMMSSYSEIMEGEGDLNNRKYLLKIGYISPDNIENKNRGCNQEDEKEKICNGLFMNKLLNHMIWWDLESIYPGYWSKIENMIRYNRNNNTIIGLKAEEKFVYFTNIILGLDLDYYFIRWGFYLDSNKHIFDGESDKYKELKKQAIVDGLIDPTIKKKYWYIDDKEYNYIINNGTGCYGDNKDWNIKIDDIREVGPCIVIYLPEINCPGHLGFEIYENDIVIGFSNTNSFIDPTQYDEGYNPIYHIVAYDRLLDYSLPSEKEQYIFDFRMRHY